MPTYEYECKSCSNTFEVFQSMSDAPIKVCPECGKEVRRIIFGGTGVIFKGSGFYVTDKGKSGTASSGGGKNSANSASGGKAKAGAEASGNSACAGCPRELPCK